MVDLAGQFTNLFGESSQTGERRPITTLPLFLDQMVNLLLNLCQCTHVFDSIAILGLILLGLTVGDKILIYRVPPTIGGQPSGIVGRGKTEAALAPSFSPAPDSRS